MIFQMTLFVLELPSLYRKFKYHCYPISKWHGPGNFLKEYTLDNFTITGRELEKASTYRTVVNFWLQTPTY